MRMRGAMIPSNLRVLSWTSKDDGDRFLNGAGLEAGPAEFAPEPAELGAAPWQTWVQGRPAVDGDRAGPDPQRQGVRAAEITGPQGRRQCVAAVVGNGDGLLVVVEGDDRADGAEDLLPGDGHRVGRVREQRRLDEVAAAVGAPASGDDAGALVATDRDVAADAFELFGVDQGAHGGTRFERVADHDLRSAVDQAVDEFVVDLAGDEDPAAGSAHLPLVGEDPDRDAIGGGVEVGVGEDDLRALAAEFESDGTEAVGRRRRHDAPGLGAASERNLVDSRVLDKQVAGGDTATGKDAEGAGRQARALDQLREEQ